MKKILLLMLILMPSMVFASSGSEAIPLPMALFMEAFISIHMSLMVLQPLSRIISPDDHDRVFWILFFIRVGILLFFDFFITTSIAFLDFFAVFGGLVLVSILGSVTGVRRSKEIVADTVKVNSVPEATTDASGMILKCASCGNVFNVNDNFCGECGAPFKGDNVVVTASEENAIYKKAVSPASFDKMFNLTEEHMVEEFIKRELAKCGLEDGNKQIPSTISHKRKIFNIIFVILIFIYLSMIFFHFPIQTYIVGLVLLFIFYKATRRYDLMKYLKKEIKARPSEKVSNIVMVTKESLVEDKSRFILYGGVVISIILTTLLFYKPRIMYENVDNGYAVRFYTFGLTNFTNAEIPEYYKGKPVISLRGNTFSNMPFLTKVTLPDTIIEIRGQAFKNDKKLVSVNIPKNLNYLGGGAFYNCKSIKTIDLPDTLTYMGGEVFYGASSLESIKLSNKLTEIRGNSFENCKSLTKITIPSNVTRIGGHAFYGNTSLSEVVIYEDSKLQEIGSSAFRQCYSLYNITIPKNAFYNERAFKESPTNIRRFGENEYNNNNNYYRNY